MGLDEILYLRFANAMLEPIWNRNYVESRADHDGRELRRRGPRPLLRSGRRAARRRRQPPHAGRRGSGDGGALRRRSRDAQGRAGRAVPRRRRRPTPPTTSAASTTATSTSTASPPTRRPRPTPRCGSTSTTGAGRASRSSSGPASASRRRRPSCGSSSSSRRGWASALEGRQPEPNQLVVQARPVDRRPARRRGPAGRAAGAGADRARHGVRAGGRRGRDALRGAAARGDGRRQHPLHPAGRRRGDVADHAAAARRAAAGAPVRAGVVGARRRPTSWSPATAAGTSPGSRHERCRRSPRRVPAAERGRALAVPADRRLRVPVRTATPARSSRPTARSTGSASRASTRPASSAACSTARPGSSGSARSGSTIPTARIYEPGTNVLVTTWKTPTGWILVRDALTMGPQRRRGRDHAAHPAAGRRRRRPHARADGRCLEGTRRGRAGLRARLRLRPRRPRSGRSVDGDRHAADATGAGQTIRLQLRPRARHRGRPRARAPRARGRATGPTARCRGPRSSPAPPDVDEADARLAATTRFWRALAGAGAHPRPPLPRPDPALGARRSRA